MRVIATLLLLLFAQLPLQAQQSPALALSQADSLALVQTWKGLRTVLLLQDRPPFTAIADSVFCYLCQHSELSPDEARMDKANFLDYGLPVFNEYRKVTDVLRREFPAYELVQYRAADQRLYPVWVVSYTVWQPNELAEGHGGASVVFEFTKSRAGFKLFQISTSP